MPDTPAPLTVPSTLTLLSTTRGDCIEFIDSSGKPCAIAARAGCDFVRVQMRAGDDPVTADLMRWQVAALLPYLQSWLDTGRMLTPDAEAPTPDTTTEG